LKLCNTSKQKSSGFLGDFFYCKRNWDLGGMLGICLPAVSPSALLPLALAWAWFCVNLLPEVLQHHEK